MKVNLFNKAKTSAETTNNTDHRPSDRQLSIRGWGGLGKGSKKHW